MGAGTNPFRYNGKELVSAYNLGWYDYGSRYYNPALGLFNSTDPQAHKFPGMFAYGYCGNNPINNIDPDGEFFFSALLGPIGAVIDVACWGAVIGGAGYTAGVAMSPGGFNNWDWGQFGSAVGFGAVSGVVTFGVGEVFGATGSFMNEIGRGVAHGLAQGGLSSLQGGDFMSGFASGAVGSWAGSAFGLTGFSKTTVGQIGFSSLMGGVSSAAFGGNFWQGAATGAMVGALNHLQHEVGSAQEEAQGQKTLEKYNELVKSTNNYISASIDLAQYFSKQEIAWLVKAGKVSWGVGWVTVGADAKLMSDAIRKGLPWGWHAYDAGIGAVGQMGLPGTAIATGVDSYVGGARYMHRVNTWWKANAQDVFLNRYFRFY